MMKLLINVALVFKKILLSVLGFIFLLLMIPVFFVCYSALLCLLRLKVRRLKPNLVWGPDPIINNKYWSRAMSEAGYFSRTIVTNVYKINSSKDFDVVLFNSGSSNRLVEALSYRIKPYYTFLYCLYKFDIFHIPATGFILKLTPLKRIEAQLLQLAQKKIVCIPYGSDFYRYSKIHDLSLRHVLLKSYPEAAIIEHKIERDFSYWIKNSHIVITGIQTDQTPRWSILPVSILVIDSSEWQVRDVFSDADGKNGMVKIIHTPNHRGFKGTEFIIEAVNQLKSEGLMVELLLIEGKPNQEVKSIMRNEADILVEQIIAPSYAMSAIEGMASGLPVMSNLSNEYYTQVFRRYSYLDECPILSTNPENLKENLKLLVTNPELRKSLRSSGRAYVEKYHSYATLQYVFHKIYAKIWHNKDVNLIDMFQPLNPESYNNVVPKIKHPWNEIHQGI